MSDFSNNLYSIRLCRDGEPIVPDRGECSDIVRRPHRYRQNFINANITPIQNPWRDRSKYSYPNIDMNLLLLYIPAKKVM